MKRFAVTFVELLIAMTMVSVLGIISISSMKLFIKDDSDLMKFKSVLATVSEAVDRLNNDTTMYPTKNGFANTESGKYEGETKEYVGPSKFRKLFKSRFNVLKDNIKFADNSIGLVPAYKYKSYDDKQGKKVELTKAVNFSDLYCFTENRGITYCLPDTAEQDLSQIFIRTYFNEIDPNNESTFDNSRAIYFMVSNDGKIEVPPDVVADGHIVFYCSSQNYNHYAQCRVRDRSVEIEVTGKYKVDK